MDEQVFYEQPLSERIRTFLRLESLFLQANHTLPGASPWDSRATLSTLFEILNVMGRADLKGEMLKELERHGAALTRLEQVPEVDQQRLNQILDQLDAQVDRLHSVEGQLGQALRQNEFINSIRQRASIPGGTCDFDLPAYHFWLERPAADRLRDLQEWLNILGPVQSAVALLLKLIRESAAPCRECAQAGFLQKSLDPDIPCQLVRVAVPPSLSCYAEISGGKHRITVRFMEYVKDGRAVQAAQDVKFDLYCCLI
ncbi:MAG: cell division protein ZapD [Gammaproteobacteria bacterium]